MNRIAQIAFLALTLFAAPAAMAQDVRISTFKSESVFTLNNQTFRVIRNQDTNAVLPPDYARTSRACPPDCIQPMTAAEGVATLGELELLSFLEDRVTGGTGLLLDARGPDAFNLFSIPGSVNIPATTLAADNRFRDDILRALGAVSRSDGTLDYSGALVLTLYGGGVWSADAPTAIDYLLDAGYPANRLRYYRGGLQAWLHAGLTVQTPQNPG